MNALASAMLGGADIASSLLPNPCVPVSNLPRRASVGGTLYSLDRAGVVKRLNGLREGDAHAGELGISHFDAVQWRVGEHEDRRAIHRMAATRFQRGSVTSSPERSNLSVIRWDTEASSDFATATPS